MKSIRNISKTAKVSERVQILGNQVLSLAEVSDKMLHRANRERISDTQALKLINYMLSFEFFQEMESYWFWLYDPKQPEVWEEIINHVYRRSITDKYLMN